MFVTFLSEEKLAAPLKKEVLTSQLVQQGVFCRHDKAADVSVSRRLSVFRRGVERDYTAVRGTKVDARGLEPRTR